MNLRKYIPSANDLRATYRITCLVLRDPKYLTLWAVFSPIFLLMLLLPTDYDIILDVIITGDESLTDRVRIMYQILPLTGSYTYSVLTDILFYIVSLTVSLNITLIIYHFREHNINLTDSTGGTIATFIAIVGSGCASCGSALIVGIFSLFGLGGLLTFLPLDGAEFLILAIIVTVYSTIWISKGLRGGVVKGCPIE